VSRLVAALLTLIVAVVIADAVLVILALRALHV